MNNAPSANKKSDNGSVVRTLAAIGAAAGYLALYFLIQIVMTAFVAFGYVLVNLPPDLEGDSILDTISYRMGEISFVVIIVSTIAMFAAVVIIRLIRDRKKPLAGREGVLCATGFTAFKPVLIPILIALGFFLNVFVSLMLTILPIPEDVLIEYEIQSSLLGETTVLSVIATTIFAPLSEELIFRHMLISRLRRGMPVTAAALIASVIFGMVHGQILWACYAFLLGLLISTVYLRARSAAASALLHAAFNGTSFILPLLPISDDAPQAVFYAIAGVAGAASVTLSIAVVLLTKEKKTAPDADEVNA